MVKTLPVFEREIEFPGFGKVLCVNNGNHSSRLKALTEVGVKPMSFEEFGYMLTNGKGAWGPVINGLGFVLGENVIYSPYKTFLTLREVSPLFDLSSVDSNLPSIATARQNELDEEDETCEANEAYERDFYLDANFSNIYDCLESIADEDRFLFPRNRRVYVLDKPGSFSVPTRNFYRDDLTRWMFKENAGNVGAFLAQKGMDVLGFRLLFNSPRNLVRELGIGFPIEDLEAKPSRIAIIGNNKTLNTSTALYGLLRKDYQECPLGYKEAA